MHPVGHRILSSKFHIAFAFFLHFVHYEKCEAGKWRGTGESLIDRLQLKAHFPQVSKVMENVERAVESSEGTCFH